MNLLQVNLNHHWAAQNLMVQNTARYNFDIVCVSEPVSVPRTPQWFSSTNGTAAIYVGSRELASKCVLNKIGSNFVVLRFNRFYIFSIFLQENQMLIFTIHWMSLGQRFVLLAAVALSQETLMRNPPCGGVRGPTGVV